jgi:ribonucleoside-diphosphate reductase alpha chain
MITEHARKILEKRYLAKDESGNLLEDVDGMFRRVADHIASAELRYYKEDAAAKVKVTATSQNFYTMMKNLDFLPNTPTLINAGRPLSQLSACFVLPIEDDTISIFDAIKYGALIHKSGGGTGYSFSKLRHNGSIVKSTKGVASGPVSFLKIFNAATECIKQGGVRRGANMGILRVDHPDILEFIDCKVNNKEINNFNLSVGVTENFMKAVIDYKPYDLINPMNGEVCKRISARLVFNKIVENAWKNGEPGIAFLDRINKDNPNPGIGVIESTNPCGEQPLLPYESCNLGSINLSNFIIENGFGRFDYDRLQDIVRKAVRFLDNVITMNKYPLPQIEEITLKTRKIGLGVMGWADALIKAGIRYDSNQAIGLAKSIMKFINDIAREESIMLAEERGSAPACSGIRNSTRTTIAPTGTLSIIANCSSGIEPLFAIAYERNQADIRSIDINPLFKKKMMDIGYTENTFNTLAERILKEGTIQHINEIPNDIKNLFVTAHDISPDMHIAMQAAFQENTDNAVSKTINLTKNATKEDVEDCFLLAHSMNCKGITIYRDGSRSEQVLSTGNSYAPEEIIEKDNPRSRPDITTGFTEKVKTGCGNLYITVNYDEDGICEVFTNIGKGGGCPSQSEATSRLISVALRSGIDAKTVIDQLKGIRCTSTVGKKLGCTSCPDAIARVVERVIEQVNDTYDMQYQPIVSVNDQMHKCPNCSCMLESEGGCLVCKNCGWSKCN